MLVRRDRDCRDVKMDSRRRCDLELRGDCPGRTAEERGGQVLPECRGLPGASGHGSRLAHPPTPRKGKPVLSYDVQNCATQVTGARHLDCHMSRRARLDNKIRSITKPIHHVRNGKMGCYGARSVGNVRKNQ